MEEPRKPSWVAYQEEQQQQQQQSRRERLWKLGERYSFLIAVGILLAGLLGVLLFFASPVAPEEMLDAQTVAALMQEREAQSAAATESESAQAGASSVLSVTTQPDGAVVFLDQEMLGVTPLENHELPEGTYALTVQITGYARVDTLVALEGGEPADLSIPLRRGAAYASLDPAPAEANRRDIPVLPRYDETLRRSGAASNTSNAGADFEAQLEQATAARSTPASGTIRPVSGNTGVAEAQPEQTAAQEATLPVQVEDQPRTSADLAASGEQTRPRTALEPVAVAPEARVGTLKVLVKPWGSIYINGALHQRETDVRYGVSLAPDVYRVTAVHPTLGASEHTVRVTAGEEASLVVDFNSPARPASVSPVTAADDGGESIAMPTLENR